MPGPVLIYSRFPKTMMARIAERFDLLDTAGGTALGAAAMDQLPALAAIVCYGTGYDGVDLAAAAARSIAVGHSPGANAASVADIAVTLMLAVTRRLIVADAYVRSGDWAAAKPSP